MSDQDCFQNNDVTGLKFTVKWQNFVKSRNFLDFIDKPLLTTMSLNGTYHTQVKLYEDEMFIWQNQSKDPLTVKSTPVTSCLVNKKRPELLIPWSLTHEQGWCLPLQCQVTAFQEINSNVIFNWSVLWNCIFSIYSLYRNDLESNSHVRHFLVWSLLIENVP